MIKNFTPRLYQQTILGTTVKHNTLVVLPTGLGKTALAFLLAAQRMKVYPNSKILMLAPTKPLCEQHVTTFQKHLTIDPEKIVLFTGSVKPEKRREMWKEAQVIISTPQGLENDVINKRVKLNEVSLLVFDECVAKGTLIKLANGQKIKIENLEKLVKENDIFVDTLNEETGNIEPRKIEKFHKIKSNKNILEIISKKNKIKVTSDHLFFCRVDNKFKWIPAKDLKVNMEVCFDNSTNLTLEKNVLVNKSDILRQYSPRQRKFYFQYLKIVKIRRNTGFGARKIAQILKVKEGTIKNWVNKPYQKPLPFGLIESLEKEGLLPLWSNNPFLPLFARLMGHLYGDGWCYRDYKGNFVIGFSGEKEDLRTIQKELSLLGVKFPSISSRETISEITQVSGKNLKVGGTTNSFCVTDKKLVKILKALKVPEGNKTKNRFLVPSWIMNGSMRIKREFLSALMGSDGYVSKLKPNGKTCHPVRLSFNLIVSLEEKGRHYALQIQKLFSDFSIPVKISKRVGNKRKDGHKTIKFLLTLSNSNESMINFLKEINYTYSYKKRQKGNQILGYLLSKRKNLDQRINQYNSARVLQQKGFGSHKIARLLKESKGTIENWIYLGRKPSIITTSMEKLQENKYEGDIFSTRWNRITKINETKNEEFVYDLTIQGNHNYFANKFLVHNCHHATGDYAYVWVANQYEKSSSYARILALTASPGSDLEKVKEVCHNLYIEKVEVRTELDQDVKPYIQQVDFSWEKVKFPDAYKNIQTQLKKTKRTKLKHAMLLGYARSPDMGKGEMLGLQRELQGKISKGERDFEALKSISLVAEALKVEHALELLESQGVRQLNSYLESVFQNAPTSKTKAVKNLVKDENFKAAHYLTEQEILKESRHPKQDKLQEITHNIISTLPDAKIIIFTQFRDSADEITKTLDELRIKNHIFVGQAKRKGLGFSQKQQKDILDQFRQGQFNVLVATSVAEEGLDIPKVDKVIFYEPVPSAIRAIQRRGRTGRLEKGMVTILMTEGTRDEGYRWSAHHKEKRMYRNLEKLKKEFTLNGIKREVQQKLVTDQVVAILADHREKDNKTVKELIDLGVSVKTAQLEVADYLVSGRVGVELKKVPDFVNSIVDGRLLDQVKGLKHNFQKSILIIEGEEDIYSVRRVHANAIRGMLSSIVLDFGVPVLYTKNPKDTAALLAVMAKREQDKGRDTAYHFNKPQNLKQQQEYFVSAFPGIGANMAKLLLSKFKKIKNLINAKEQDLLEIEGVGPKTTKRLLEFVEEEYQNKD